MTAENKAKFIVDLSGNVAQKAKSFGSAISGMGKSGSRSMKLLSASISASNKMLDKFDNKLVGFATGGGLVMAAKKVGNWQQQITELGTSYNLTAEQSDKFLDTIYAAGAAYKMPYNDVVTALDKMLERTNDVSGSISNIDNVAKAIKGLGLSADEAGLHVSQLMNKGFTPEGIGELLNGVASASKIGTGSIKEQLANVMELTKGTPWQSPEQLMQLLAIQRLSDAQLGNSADAAAALTAFADALKDKEKQKILEKNSIDIYQENDRTQFKDPGSLLLEIGNRAKFEDKYLKTVFPENLIKITKTFADSAQQQKLLKGVKIEDGLLDEKVSKNVNTFNGALTSLTNAGERWAQLKLGKPIQDLADAINALTPEQLDDYTSKLETGAKIIGGAIAARYIYKGAKTIKNVLGGKRGKFNNAADSAIAAGEGVTPVYVTNWPTSFSSGGGNGASAGSGFNNLLKALGVAGLILDLADRTWELSELPDHHPVKKMYLMQQNPEQFYDEGNSQTWVKEVFNPEIDNSIQNFGKTLSHALATIGESLDAEGQLYLAPVAKEEPQTIKGNVPILKDKSEIVLKVESSDNLTVKTKSIRASDTDIVVNTGKTYGGMY